MHELYERQKTKELNEMKSKLEAERKRMEQEMNKSMLEMKQAIEREH